MIKASKDFSKILNLYLIDEIVNPFFSIKSIDTVIMNIKNNIEFDSYILNYKQIGNDESKISLRY